MQSKNMDQKLLETAISFSYCCIAAYRYAIPMANSADTHQTASLVDEHDSLILECMALYPEVLGLNPIFPGLCP